MKIRRVQIVNLFSYEESQVNPEDYTVVVGPNGSGKTNIIRLLRILTGQDEPEKQLDSFNRIVIRPELALQRGISAVRLDVTFSQKESRMILQTIVHDDLTNQFKDNNMRNITLLVAWPNTNAEILYPDVVLLRFPNGLTISGNNYELINLDSIPDSVSEVIQLIDGIRSVASHNDLITGYPREHGFDSNQLLARKEFIDSLVEGRNMSTLFTVSGISVKIPTHQSFLIGYNWAQPGNYQKEIFDYCGVAKTGGNNIDLWLLIRYIFKNSIIHVPEMRPDHDTLADRMMNFKNSGRMEHVYNQIKNSFSELFANTQVEVFDDDTRDGKRFIQVTEKSSRGSKKFRLTKSASGYFEVLFIFSELISHEDTVIIMDEPALHLHPVKIRSLARMLANLSASQVIVISHSPYFVSTNLFERNKALAYVKKMDHVSRISNKSFNFTDTKPHILNPELFFCKISLIVEGPGDEYALRAMSDSLNDALGRHDVALINCNGRDNMPMYVELVKGYSLDHVILLDNNYLKTKHANVRTSDTMILSGNLEDDFAKLGWDARKHATPIEAYTFVATQMKNEKAEVRSKMELAQVLNRALTKAGADIASEWEMK